MCFSASASFTTGTILIAGGSYCIIKSKNNKKHLPLALIPFLFGIQQIFEGFLWLKIQNGENFQTQLLGFLFFSHFLWPIIVPLTALTVESNQRKKSLCKIFLLIGTVLAGMLYLPEIIFSNIYHASIVKNSICYKHFLAIDFPKTSKAALIVYAIIILAPLLISSHKHLKIFGILIGVAMIATYIFYNYAFTSVWCIFAAILSLYIIWFLNQESPLKTN